MRVKTSTINYPASSSGFCSRECVFFEVPIAGFESISKGAKNCLSGAILTRIATVRFAASCRKCSDSKCPSVISTVILPEIICLSISGRIGRALLVKFHGILNAAKKTERDRI